MRLGGCPGGTSRVGWGFDTVPVGEDFVRRYTVAEANAALPDALRTNAVFNHFPAEMFQSNIPPATVNELLAKGVPSLSAAAGVRLINNPNVYNWNVDTTENKPNGWGRSGGAYSTRWLHSDLKNMAYLYVYELFDQLVLQGGLR